MRRFLFSLVLAVAVGGPGITWVAAPAEAAEAAVTLTHRADPATLTVAPGTRVTFANQSGDRRRIRSEDGPADFDSGNLEAGESWSVVLDVPGNYPYVDERSHDPAYQGTITVSSTTSPGGGAPNTPAPDGLPPAGSTPPGGSPAGGSSPPSAPSTASVAILDRSFSPAAVTIAPGGTVSWANQSDRDHTVTGTGFDSGIIDGGGRFSHTFPSAGTFSYVCELHSEMRASVTVAGGTAAAQPSPAVPAASAASSPTFAAPGVPSSKVSPAGPTSTTSLGPPSETATPETVEVSIVDLAFEPATVRLVAGGTVTWRHNGVAPHTVTAEDSSFDSGLVRAGGTFSHRFDRAGTFRYVCAFHPGMAGTVEIADASSAPSAEPIVDAPSASSAEPKAENGEQAAASLAKASDASSPSGAAVLAALVGGAAILAGTGALLYGGSRMLAADDRP